MGASVPSRSETAAALVRLVRHDVGTEPVAGLRESLATDAARWALHAQATRHGVLAVVLAGLEAAAGGDPVLAEACRPLLAQRAVIRKRAAMWDLETERLLRLLDARGLQPVTLKGAALRVSTYRDSAERSFGDVDLLLPPSEITPAVAGLTAAGYELGDDAIAARYRQHHFHYRLTNPMGFQVELHWALQPPGAMIRLSPERILGRSRSVERPGAPTIRVPSPEDMVLHLASQETEDWFSTIRRLVDIDRILRTEPAFDWGYLRTAAAESGMRPILALTLQLTRRLLSAPVPAGFVRTLDLSPPTRFHLSLLDPVRSVLTSYASELDSAPRFLAVWLAPDSKARRRTIQDIATGRFDWFDPRVEKPEPAWGRASWLRGTGSLAKLSTFWFWLYLRHGGQLMRRSTASGPRFWEDPEVAAT